MLGCKECAFNFDGVCAGQRYGQEVNDSFKFECDEFKMSLEIFSFYNERTSSTLSRKETKNDMETKKSPKEMNPVELLETYSHYNRILLRDKEEQDYIALLRAEMLERMRYEI